MTFDSVFEKLHAHMPSTERVDSKIDPSIKVPSDKIVEALTFLRDALDFETIANLGGIDFPKENKLCVFYHPTSYKHKLIVCLKVFVERNDAPEIPSTCSVYKACNWFERETFDMFGIHFTGHPDHRRILLPEDWKAGYPLLKDFVTPDYYNGMPVPLYFDEAPKANDQHTEH